MQTQKKTKIIRYSAVAITVLLCICIAFISGAQSLEGADNLPVVPMADATLNSDYGALYRGSTYRYTDYTKVEDMHNGVITDDTTAITINPAATHGTKENPFVIDSISRWQAFASDMNNTTSGISNYGAGLYFVLAKDLNFASSTFAPVVKFCGNFFGLGHTISNITYSYGNATNSNSGVFGSLMGDSVVADLNLDNINFSDMYSNAGLLCGNAAETRILNCHAKGVLSRPTRLGIQVNIGGIAGSAYTNDDVTVYRCSTSYSGTFMVSSLNGALIGTVVGGAGGSGKIDVFDCYGRGIVDYNNDRADAYIGGMLGAFADKTGPVRIENGASFIFQQNVQNNTASHVASLLGFWAGTAAPPSLTIKNVYTSGKGSRSGSEFDVYPAVYLTSQISRINSINLNVSNANWYAGSNLKYDSPSGYGELLTTRAAANTTRYSTSENDLWQAAKDTSTLPSAIWTNKSAIGATNYTIEDSPVRNDSFEKEQFDVEFYNYKDNTDESIGVSSIKYDYGATGTALAEPTAPDDNHKFVGWTTDKSGEGEVFGILPDNAYGDIKLYAVWDNPNATAEITLYNSKTQDSTDTLEYGTGNIKLTGTSSGPGMTNPLKSYKWYKDGESSAVESGDSCTLSNVNDSGEYELEYTLQDTIEPLWIHKEKLSTTQRVNITKGKLHIKSFEIEETTPAYVGRKVGELDFALEVKDSGENAVSYSRAVWQSPNSPITEGTNDSFNISITPEDTDNYETAMLTVTFESEYLKLTFDLDAGIAGEKIEVNLEYGEPCSANEIIRMFLEAFRSIIDDESNPLQPLYKDVENLAPYFDGVEINQYNTNLIDVTEPQKIEVMFIDKNYTITIKPDNGSADITQMRKFNQRLLPVTNPTKDEHVFKGWKYDDADDNGNTVTKYWDMETDRVKGDMTLTADWFKATLTLESIDVTAKAGGYEALTVMQDGDLEVIAHYTTDSAEYPTYEQKIKLDDISGYKIIYSSSDGKLHVNNAGITVTYTYGGVTKTKAMTLTVTPKSLDEEMKANGVTFENKTVVYDGSAKEIGEVKGELPIQISEVEYEYWIGGRVVDKSEVVNIGLYTVRAKFISSDPDYNASDMEATLTISRT
ncbi:MAG: InlB B-repeat-containing protein, partial [Clostridia bacterium]|nr:InlB B-repeat-containing protein [Clostridia bacterium]